MRAIGTVIEKVIRVRGMRRAGRLTLAVALLFLPATLAFIAPVRASGAINITAGDVAALKAAIGSANGGGATTITIVGTGTFMLTTADNTGADGANGLPVITGSVDVTINGGGAMIQGPSAFRFFSVSAGATLRLNNLTLQGGQATGASGTAGSAGMPCAGSGAEGGSGGNGTAAGDARGGAILNSGTLFVTGTTFSQNNVFGGQGGAGGDAADGCNSTTPSGLGGKGGDGGGGSDGASGYGGAIFSTGTVTVTTSTFTANSVGGGNGGMGGAGSNGGSGGTGTQAAPGGDGGDSGKTGGGGSGGIGAGGAIYSTGMLTVTATTFSGNTAFGAPGTRGSTQRRFGGFGGGGFSHTISNPGSGTNGGKGGNGSEPTNAEGGNNGGNGGMGSGGAINSAGGILAVSNSTFAGNGASGGPGANGGFGAAAGSGSSGGNGSGMGNQGGRGGNGGNGGQGGSGGNGGSASGGAIAFAGAGSSQVVNSTFSANSANGSNGGNGGPGGAMGSGASGGGGDPKGSDGTVGTQGADGGSGIGAAGTGGGIVGGGRGLTIVNTILAASIGTACSGVSDGGNNLEFPGTSCGFVASAQNGNPNLGPLMNNGGPTQTLALGSGSAAASTGNAAICAADYPNGANKVDQRGFARPTTTCSIGAFEAQGSPSSSGGLQFFPLSAPVRLLDTRPGQSAVVHPNAPLTPNQALTLPGQFTSGGITIPAGAQALVGNATVDNTINAPAGFATLYPSGASLPLASNLNFVPGTVRPNAFTVSLGADGKFNILSNTGGNFIIDLTGYYAPPAAGGLFFHPLSQPVRLLDTRAGQSAFKAPGAALTPSQTLSLPGRFTSGGITIPSSAKALAGNATVDNTANAPAGFATLFPGGTSLPPTSNLNFAPGTVAPNAFTVGLGGDGSFNLYSNTGGNFILDVTGYYDTVGAGGLLFFPLSQPVRELDTRAGQQAFKMTNAPFTAGQTLNLPGSFTFSGVTVPAGAKALVGNATVDNTINAPDGFAALFPGGTTLPLASNLNYRKGTVAPNAFIVGIGSDGTYNLYSLSGGNFIIDISGYFAAGTGTSTVSPAKSG